MANTLSDQSSKDVNWLSERPIAHRGLHDAKAGVMENSLSAAAAAMRRDYPIELDLQMSKDRIPIVFHDEELDRMTGAQGNVRDMTFQQLSGLRLKGSNDGIAPLSELLDLVKGDVGLVVEIKGKPGSDEGFVEAVLNAFKGYSGDFVLMSFDHQILDEIAAQAPQVPLGLTAYGEEDRYTINQNIADRLQVDFISYYVKHLETRFVRKFRNTGKPAISWTIVDPPQAEYALKYSDQITFENFLP